MPQCLRVYTASTAGNRPSAVPTSHLRGCHFVIHHPSRVEVRQYRNVDDARCRASEMDLVIHAKDGTAWVVTMTPLMPAG